MVKIKKNSAINKKDLQEIPNFLIYTEIQCVLEVVILVTKLILNISHFFTNSPLQLINVKKHSFHSPLKKPTINRVSLKSSGAL